MTSESKADRWGVSEWFGRDVFSMTDAERLAAAVDALKPANEVGRRCPSMGTFIPGFVCNKNGGVCSTQKYVVKADRIVGEGVRVAICPSRLVTKDVLRHIAKTVLGSEDVALVKEVPYSHSLINKLRNGKPKAAGRIDWLLVDTTNSENFCAVETQSVYMSGKTQEHDFNAVISERGKVTMPPNYRHPDYKSSVPKRLGPQLESKAKHLNNASKKTVVLVDAFVQENMSTLREVAVPDGFSHNWQEERERKLETCEVILAVVELDRSGKLSEPSYKFSTISDTSNALNAVAPMTKTEFFHKVKEIVRAKGSRGKKVFPLAEQEQAESGDLFG